MSNEFEQPNSFEIRKAASPIHNSINVDKYLEAAKIPPFLERSFHEMVILRGQFPPTLTDEQDALLNERIINETMELELEPEEAIAFKVSVFLLTAQWAMLKKKGII